MPVATIDAVPAAAVLHADRGSDAGRPVEHPAEHEVAQDRRPLVLVVEDNLLNQKVAVHRLERLGCRVDVGSDGVQALTRIEETLYDVVFMDLQMPRWTVSRAPRPSASASAAGRLPIVAMTAHDFPEDRRRCLDAGMNAHVSKPLADHALQAVIQRLMDRAHGFPTAP